MEEDEPGCAGSVRAGGGAMITRGHRQEGLCRAYVEAVAAHAGLVCARPELDYGIDLSFRLVEVREERWRDTRVQLDVQLKSTTRASVSGAEVSYDLEVGAYNDLRAPDCGCPRILVVLVMPTDEAEWLSQTPEGLTLRHCAYWISLKGRPPTGATKTIRVGIPLANVFSPAALAGLMQRVAQRKEP